MEARNARVIVVSLLLAVVSSTVALGAAMAMLELAIREGAVSWALPPFNPYGHKDPGTARVLILGDSFSRLYPETFAFGNLLQAALTAHGIETLNLAWSGYGPVDSLRALSRHGQRFKPDLVVLGYYVGNDLTDTIGRLHGAPIEQAIADASARPRGWDGLALQFPSLVLLADRWQHLHMPVLPEAAEPSGTDAQPLNPFWRTVARDAPEFHRVNLLLEGDGSRGWEANKEVLTQMYADVERLGSQMLVIAFPSTLQIDTTHYEFFEKLGIEVDSIFLSSRKPQDLLKTHCGDLGIPLVDLLPAFRRHAGEALYWERDDHLNAAGNALAFDEVWSNVRARRNGAWSAASKRRGRPSSRPRG